ncbi:MAG: signal peptidase II [Candidatus Woesearchaeota archaeon]|nr:signal peptidase II [Candidatus Woesearchaeota archaeon]
MDKKTLTFASIAAIVFALDQITNIIVERAKPSLDLGILSIDYTTNTGAAFSMFQGKNMILTLLSVIVIAAIIYVIFFSKDKGKISKGIVFFSAFLFGGALGNLADRLIYGFVIDFIDFGFWPAFNVADIAITSGVIRILYLLYKE